MCDALRNLVPFVQFKKREKHPWRSVNFRKVAGLHQIFERPHFFVKETFKPYHLIKFYEKYLYETIPSIRLTFFKIIQR